MPPLTGPRDACKRIGDVWNYPVKAGEIIFKGAAVCLDVNGEAVNATAAAGLVTAGVARDTVDNTDDGKTLDVEEGVYQFHNAPAGADQILQGDARHLCYWLDNHTVAAVATGRSVAGVIKSIDPGNKISVSVVSFAAPATPPAALAERRDSDAPGAGVPTDTIATPSDYKAP
jgi:hypothetical protein